MSVRFAETADGALVRRHREGDEGQPFAVLYSRFFPRLVRTCERRTHDRALSEDIAQETLIRALANIGTFDASRPLWPWLKTIATRLIIDHMRERCREVLGEPVDRPIDCDDENWRVERPILNQSLSNLPSRQNIAMQLRYLDDWTPSEVANFLGLTRNSTEQLLHRARLRLRREYQKVSRGMLGTILLPLGAIRRRLHRAVDEIRARIGSSIDPFLSASSSSIASGVAALVVTLAALAPIAPVATHSLGGATPAGGSTQIAPARGTSQRVLAAAPTRSSRGSGSLARRLLDPTKDATPEDTQFTSIAESPDYENDHMLFASGTVCPRAGCEVLFVSRDGGATWTQSESRDFRGHSVLLPPNYPADPRIFAMGSSGLQVSADAGQSFELALPIEGDVAISPLFDSSDPRILIGASVVTEYWAYQQPVAKPAALIGPAGKWLTVAFSPAYAKDLTIFAGGVRPDAGGTLRPTVNRCADYVCDSVVFSEGGDAPEIRISPRFDRDSVVYAFNGSYLFRSKDRGTTFESSTPWGSTKATIKDLLVSESGAIYAALESSNGRVTGVFRSVDGGATWNGGRVRFNSFEHGVRALSLTPDGRLIALSSGSGLACSSDLGRTWAARCNR